MRPIEDPDRPPEINLLPMIDVIFSILAFFIISTLFLTYSEGLPVDLPEASSSQPQQSVEITVTIASDGEIALNRQPIDLTQLADATRVLTQPDIQNLAIVNADENVIHGRVVSVMDELRQVEGVKLAIATQRQ